MSARKARAIVTVRRTFAAIEIGRDHRSVESDPAEFLPEENLERSDIAEAQQDFRRGRQSHQAIEQIIRAVTAARAENRARRVSAKASFRAASRHG